jgi:hypothetical protein
MPKKPKVKLVAGPLVTLPSLAMLAEERGDRLFFNGRSYAPSFITSMPFRCVMGYIESERLFYAVPQK